jgi:hypothetical protein
MHTGSIGDRRDQPATHPHYNVGGFVGRLLNYQPGSMVERESGTARLEEAVNAYREALQERIPELWLLHRATTQNKPSWINAAICESFDLCVLATLSGGHYGRSISASP